MRVLVAMSGGVDSSVTAALLMSEGHHVVGATMKLWGGPSSSGCCSVADVDDARRVCQQLGIDHHVFNFTGEFERDVVRPYAEAHAKALTPNPCIACNAHLKFDRFLERARALRFDAIATGHHARVAYHPADPDEREGAWRLHRGRDAAKDQSYVLYMLGQDQLRHLLLPIGEMTKSEVRELASARGLRTAAKPDSQDVCFVTRSEGREGFLRERVEVGAGRLVDRSGGTVGHVAALELLTIGQRRGLGSAPQLPAERRYVISVDLGGRTATLGPLEDLLVSTVAVRDPSWSGKPAANGAALIAQLSAHGQPSAAVWREGHIDFEVPVRRPAPGQAVVLYRPGDEAVLGGGTAAGQE